MNATVKTVDEFYIELIIHYKATGKIGNSNIYRDSYNSIKTFKKTDKLDFLFTEISYSRLLSNLEIMESSYLLNNSMPLSIAFFNFVKCERSLSSKYSEFSI